ncbi:hypothetical protein Tco_1430035 [Tanacetum coccineum]
MRRFEAGRDYLLGMYRGIESLIIIRGWQGLPSGYAFSDSLLLTPLCCDDIHDVMPRVSALAGCDRLVSEPLVIENSLIPLSRGSFDVLVGMDRLSKRKFGIVCHEKVVRIPLEGDEILRVHGERTQGVVKTLMNTKTRVSYDLVIFRKEHQCRLLRRGAWSSFEVSVGITEEGEVVTYLRFIANFSKIVKPHTSLTERNQKKERVKPRRVRAMAMTIQYGVRGMILAAQSEAFKQENVLAERLHGLRYLSENEIESPWILSVNFQDNSKEWNSGDDQLRFRWMIYLVVLADAAESVSDAIRFEYCLASSSGWTNIWCAPFEALYGRKCRSHVNGKIGGTYRLRFPEELSGVHDTFHVSNLKKCLADASLHVPLDEIKVDKTLCFVEEPVEIMDREVKRLKCSRMVVVRVHLGSKRGKVVSSKISCES